MNNVYVFIDPFNKPTSGVTSYTRLAAERIKALGLAVRIIAREGKESLQSFRKRLPPIIASLGNLICVEAPESLSATQYLPADTPLHIRLHCSQSLGAFIQGLSYREKSVCAEQREIGRAKWVTAPSKAVETASRLLFSLPNEVPVYPNPLPEAQSPCIQPDVDIMFVGRWQRFKGTHHFLRLIEEMPNRAFVIVSPNAPRNLPRNVQFISASDVDDMLFVLARTKLVVIPSLFEAASMVGLEALACGRLIVTWAHIGLAEYAIAPYVHAVEPWNFAELLETVEKALGGCNPNDFEKEVRRLNTGFDSAIRSLVDTSTLKGNYGLQGEAYSDLENILRSLAANETERKVKNLFTRRIRKLIRSPQDFWLDSKLRKIFVAPGAALRKEAASPTVPVPLKKEIPPSYSLKIRPPIKGDPPPEKQITPSESARKLFADIRREGRIEYSEPPIKPAGLVTAFLYQKHEAGIAEVVLAALDTFKDFRPTQRGVIQEGLFVINDLESPLSIANRTDVKNKEKISKVNNLILLNPRQNLVSALRACGYRQRMIVLLTNGQNAEHTIDPGDVDALIVVESHATARSTGLRRILTIASVEQAGIAIRRVIQEGAPRSPDVLLPLINANTYRPYLIDFDSQRYQGIIRLRCSSPPIASSMRELIQRITSEIESMLVLESVYMRYRSLCEAVEKGESPARFIETCLLDGILFHVES